MYAPVELLCERHRALLQHRPPLLPVPTPAEVTMPPDASPSVQPLSSDIPAQVKVGCEVSATFPESLVSETLELQNSRRSGLKISKKPDEVQFPNRAEDSNGQLSRCSLPSLQRTCVPQTEMDVSTGPCDDGAVLDAKEVQAGDRLAQSKPPNTKEITVCRSAQILVDNSDSRSWSKRKLDGISRALPTDSIAANLRLTRGVSLLECSTQGVRLDKPESMEISLPPSKPVLPDGPEKRRVVVGGASTNPSSLGLPKTTISQSLEAPQQLEKVITPPSARSHVPTGSSRSLGQARETSADPAQNETEKEKKSSKVQVSAAFGERDRRTSKACTAGTSIASNLADSKVSPLEIRMASAAGAPASFGQVSKRGDPNDAEGEGGAKGAAITAIGFKSVANLRAESIHPHKDVGAGAKNRDDHAMAGEFGKSWNTCMQQPTFLLNDVAQDAKEHFFGLHKTVFSQFDQHLRETAFHLRFDRRATVLWKLHRCDLQVVFFFSTKKSPVSADPFF